MHIEPGFIAPGKVLLANVAATGLLAWYARDLLRRPTELLRSLLAALFFSLFMQAFHAPVGASELHFVGAMLIYMTLGFLPTLFGFAIGLLLQGLLFEPADLVHLAVNGLSLILPLLLVHYSFGQGLRQARRPLSRRELLKLDAVYYSGVTAMVGFWLAIGETATPFTAWLQFAAAYLAVVALEPLLTFATVRLLRRGERHPLIDSCFAVSTLKLAE